jgi:hypothetical protein
MLWQSEIATVARDDADVGGSACWRWHFAIADFSALHCVFAVVESLLQEFVLAECEHPHATSVRSPESENGVSGGGVLYALMRIGISTYRNGD